MGLPIVNEFHCPWCSALVQVFKKGESIENIDGKTHWCMDVIYKARCNCSIKGGVTANVVEPKKTQHKKTQTANVKTKKRAA